MTYYPYWQKSLSTCSPSPPVRLCKAIFPLVYFPSTLILMMHKRPLFRLRPERQQLPPPPVTLRSDQAALHINSEQQSLLADKAELLLTAAILCEIQVLFLPSHSQALVLSIDCNVAQAISLCRPNANINSWYISCVF